MEPKIKVEYDDRRKVLVQTFDSVQEVKNGDVVVGEGVMKRVSTFNEDGIRNILKDLEAQKKITETNLKKLRELKSNADLNDRQKQLKEDIKILQITNHQENITAEDLKKEDIDLKANEENLIKVKKDISDIKNAVGTRLKF